MASVKEEVRLAEKEQCNKGDRLAQIGAEDGTLLFACVDKRGDPQPNKCGAGQVIGVDIRRSAFGYGCTYAAYWDVLKK